MPQGRYPLMSEEERAEIERHRRVKPTALNSGLSVNQVFMVIEEMLASKKRDIATTGLYTIWSKFLKLSGEPTNRLLYAKLCKGYIGPLFTNDAQELSSELLPNGIPPLELGRRFRLLRGAFETKRLNKYLVDVDVWEDLSDTERAADAFAAQEVFDLGYQLGLSEAKRVAPMLVHMEDITHCLCTKCLKEVHKDAVIRQARKILVRKNG